MVKKRKRLGKSKNGKKPKLEVSSRPEIILPGAEPAPVAEPVDEGHTSAELEKEEAEVEEAKNNPGLDAIRAALNPFASRSKQTPKIEIQTAKTREVLVDDEADECADDQELEQKEGSTHVEEQTANKPTKITKQAPDWTSRFYVIDKPDRTPFEDLPPMNDHILSGLKAANISSFFPVQAAVIPMLLRAGIFDDGDSPYSVDIAVSVPTGQGKTLAFVVPMVQHALKQIIPAIRGIVILPTRDLAEQVLNVFQLFCGKRTGGRRLNVTRLIGETSFADEVQRLQKNTPDFIVCTPGRLVEHHNAKTLDLSMLRWLVIDEADRVVSSNINQVVDVLVSLGQRKVGMQPQKLLFSATMTKNPQQLAVLNLNRPLFFLTTATGAFSLPKELTQWYTNVPDVKSKAHTLLYLLQRMQQGPLDGDLGDVTPLKILIFCCNVDTAHRITRFLQLYYSMDDTTAPSELKPSKIPLAAYEFSSSLGQKQRSKIISEFRSSKDKGMCLVCSDVIARGVDVPDVDVVINFDVPSHLSTYIHRVGRTARAGRKGTTVTLVQNEEIPHFLSMTKGIKSTLKNYHRPTKEIKPFQKLYSCQRNMMDRVSEAERKGLDVLSVAAKDYWKNEDVKSQADEALIH